MVELNGEDEYELLFLEDELAKIRASITEYNYHIRRSLLDAIVSGEAERTGVDTMKAIKLGSLSILERERGERNGDVFYFDRCFRHHGQLYPLDSLFNLPPSSAQYAHLE